jgi:hypothetical protein
LIAKGAVRAHAVIVRLPGRDQDMDLGQAVEDLAVEHDLLPGKWITGR